MNVNRIRKLNEKRSNNHGPIVYWMNRDHRVRDNWAVVYAMRLAVKFDQHFAIVFSLRKDLDKHFGTRRMLDFMIGGLSEVEKDAKKLGIGFHFLYGDPVKEVPKFVKDNKVSHLITDFSPLNTPRWWKDSIAKHIEIPFYEVDTHNIIPCWVASDKQEYAARTIRPKIHKKLDEYLDEFPRLEKLNKTWDTNKTDWKSVSEEIAVLEDIKVSEFIPGTKTGYQMMDDFIENRLSNYNELRNQPVENHLSQLSPYFHFGQISPQRVAMAVQAVDLRENQASSEDREAFLEEMIVRRELSDNFCFYNKDYKSTKCFSDWAQKTLEDHKEDEREFIYTKSEFEKAKTHDESWNAAQLEMVKTGKMHGYMRMYWAKKILEWTNNAQEAMDTAIYLNDLYSIDGRDPNGYVGIAWSIGGVHDRGWTERPIFGKIRFMNFNGLKRKFDIEGYIEKWCHSI